MSNETFEQMVRRVVRSCWERDELNIEFLDTAKLATHLRDELAAVAAPAGVPDGWKLVPVEATHEMCKAAHDGPNMAAEYHMTASDRQYWEDCYRAMLSAAPAAPADTVAKDGSISNTEEALSAREKYAELYNGDDREGIQADVMNAFGAGIVWAEKHFAKKMFGE